MGRLPRSNGATHQLNMSSEHLGELPYDMTESTSKKAQKPGPTSRDLNPPRYDAGPRGPLWRLCDRRRPSS
ncbi:hypothetical protein CEP54_014669 [Fusarium duplospermum]|uniref:Uncharacterized protein n=1 Tax=Fusarium duplospermum TaxID=1325734 RepID=A0A428NUM9_9HYPO|nr:hypothetical protein CEP54_014669 [Fusarium duplospermum]